MRERFWLFAVSTILFAILWSPSAFARAGFAYEVDNKKQTDQGYPVLKLKATGGVASGTVKIERSDGKDYSRKLGSMKTGEIKKITLKQPKGTLAYKVSIEAKGTDGDSVNTSIDFKATYVDPIRLKVDPKKAQIKEGKLPLQSNRPIDRVDVEVYDDSGNKLFGTTQRIGGKSGTFMIKWPPHSNVAAIKLRAYDTAEFWNALMLEPFWVKIPHKEVIFNFGKATWEDKEEPKLTATMKHIRKAMKKHAHKGLQMQLYVAGYTDTVGSKAQNKKLSRARARAIARWFSKNGLDIPIYYQGFGESVLAVQTKDEKPEPKNRRALYILGNAEPPTSSQIPKSNWKRIQ